MSSHQKVTAPNGTNGLEVGTGESAGSAPLIVVSNRLPFVLTRDKIGKLRRSHRYVAFHLSIQIQSLKNGGVKFDYWPFS